MAVLLYSSPRCPYCKMAKDFFIGNKVDFVDIDVSKDAEKAKEAVKKSGHYLVPIIDINGKIIVGFDKAKIKKELGIK